MSKSKTMIPAKLPTEDQPSGEILKLPTSLGWWWCFDDESELWCPFNITELDAALREIEYQKIGDGRWIKDESERP